MKKELKKLENKGKITIIIIDNLKKEENNKNPNIKTRIIKQENTLKTLEQILKIECA